MVLLLKRRHSTKGSERDYTLCNPSTRPNVPDDHSYLAICCLNSLLFAVTQVRLQRSPILGGGFSGDQIKVEKLLKAHTKLWGKKHPADHLLLQLIFVCWSAESQSQVMEGVWAVWFFVCLGFGPKNVPVTFHKGGQPNADHC